MTVCGTPGRGGAVMSHLIEVIAESPAGAAGPVAAAQSANGVPIAALVPFVLLAAGFVAYCVQDAVRHEVRHLPKWVWILICVVSVPAGGIAYLLFGRAHR